MLVEPKDISTASVRDLCLFIRDTGLLNVYWLEYLGLYNKPKAEVHPGHKLTGTKEEEEEACCVSTCKSLYFELPDAEARRNFICYVWLLVVLRAFVCYVITCDNALSVECPICVSLCLANKGNKK